MTKRRLPLTGTIRAGKLEGQHSDLANNVFDLLLGGQLAAAEQLRDSVFHDLPALLAELLRSDEPLPNQLRLALANVIDGQDDPPIRISWKVIRKPQAWRVLDDLIKEDRALDAYEAAIGAGATGDDAVIEASRAAGVNGRDVVAYISAGRVRRNRTAEIIAAKEVGSSIDEIADLISSPLPKPHPGRLRRGRKQKAT